MSTTNKGTGTAAGPNAVAHQKPANRAKGNHRPNAHRSSRVGIFATTTVINNLNVDQITATTMRATFSPTPANATVAAIADNNNHPNDPALQFAGARQGGGLPAVFLFAGLSPNTSYTIHAFAIDGGNVAGHASKAVSTTP